MITKRDKERAKLHGAVNDTHGWLPWKVTHIPQPGQILMWCPCGWRGFVSVDVVPVK